MTLDESKAIVHAVWPDAEERSHRFPSGTTVYTVSWKSSGTYVSSGDTPEIAWQRAAQTINAMQADKAIR